MGADWGGAAVRRSHVIRNQQEDNPDPALLVFQATFAGLAEDLDCHSECGEVAGLLLLPYWVYIK